MSDTAWIGLVTLAATLVIAAFTGIFNLLSKIGRRFNEMNERADARANSITNKLMAVYDKHEERDQERHTENVQRLTRLETLVNGNYTRKRRAGV